MHAADDTLTIRPITDADAEDYLAIFSDEEICRYDDFAPMTRHELAATMVQIQLNYRQPGAVREYAIELNAEQRMVGVFTLTPKRKYLYIGYHLNRAYHGRGLATRAVRLVIGIQPPATRAVLRALIDPENAPSIAVVRKCGFQLIRMRRAGLKRELVYALEATTA